MIVCGSTGKFYFLSLPVNQLAPWIQCVFHGNNKVPSANEALKQLGCVLFCLTLSKVYVFCHFFLQLRQIFCR